MRLILALLALPSAAMADIIDLDCAFPAACGANMACGDGSLSLHFEVDRDTRRVVLTDGEARTEVSVAQGADAISFHTHLPTGGFHTTTFAASGAAVHSRHMMIEGQLAPSQHYGTCTERRRD